MIKIPATREQVLGLRTKLADSGTSIIPLGVDDYQITGHGVSAMAKFDGEQLEITVTKKPMLVTIGFVEGKIRQGIEEALAS